MLKHLRTIAAAPFFTALVSVALLVLLFGAGLFVKF